MRLLFLPLVWLVWLPVLAGCGSGGETTPAAAPGQAIAIAPTEFAFDPSSITIDSPGTYAFDLSNNGSVGHALEVEGQDVKEETETVAPGSSAQLTVTFSKAGTYEFYCPVDGHRGQGMEGTVAVGGGGGATGTMMENEGGTDTGGAGYGGYGYGSG
ncbi:MAG: cupredoxin domain-containing protein [Gaiellaceae bacterium]